MGNYNTQYQSYYNNLTKKQRGTNNFSSESNTKSRILDIYIKRLTKELIGVLVLFIFVLFCKVVVTPKTEYVFKYSKTIINQQYEYGTLIDKAKLVKFSDIQSIPVNFIEMIKSTVSSGDKINNKSTNYQEF